MADPPALAVILTAHTPDAFGMCAGCRAWWGRIVPHPCTQVEWARLMAGHAMTERFLDPLHRPKAD